MNKCAIDTGFPCIPTILESEGGGGRGYLRGGVLVWNNYGTGGAY